MNYKENVTKNKITKIYSVKKQIDKDIFNKNNKNS
jgi:hypothetical protein